MNRFVRFRPTCRPRNPVPRRMSVGQIVSRDPCPHNYRGWLKSQMTRAMLTKNMLFSIRESKSGLDIRRDR